MAKNTKPSSAPGALPWTSVVVALGTAGALIWAVMIYFFPNPTPQIPAPTPSVTVSGHDNVGVGTMQGGQIIVGGGTTTPPAHTSAPPQEERQP